MELTILQVAREVITPLECKSSIIPVRDYDAREWGHGLCIEAYNFVTKFKAEWRPFLLVRLRLPNLVLDKERAYYFKDTLECFAGLPKAFDLNDPEIFDKLRSEVMWRHGSLKKFDAQKLAHLTWER